MSVDKELDFEKNIIEKLIDNGWKNKEHNSYDQNKIRNVLESVDENELIQNWKNILFYLNRNKLNNVELNDDEMNQILFYVKSKSNVIARNSILVNEVIEITRTNPLDKEQKDKKVTLSLFSRKKVGGGDTVYQIARQVRIKITDTNKNEKDYRFDIVLLINGIPLIQIELKNEKTDINNAVLQIKNYHQSGCYQTGIFSMITIFVAMNKNQMVYFANQNDKKDFELMRWTDRNNKEIQDWERIVNTFLNIPTAHHMVANYIVSNEYENKLLVLRSYQIHAINSVINLFNGKKDNLWETKKHNEYYKGGYVWHTTGSGKTLTSFKLAKILVENYADYVVFVVDRKELETQTLNEYQMFNKNQVYEVDQAQSIEDLREKINKSTTNKSIIISTIQKASGLTKNLSEKELENIRRKRIIFIFDEAHRSTFEDMMNNIKDSFPNSIIFGFTGTPIKEENSRAGDITTKTIFGEELHRYTVKEGIDDKKVLPFRTKYPLLKRYYILFFIWKIFNMERYTNNKFLDIDWNDIHSIESNIEKINQFINEKVKEDEIVQKWNLIKDIDDYMFSRQESKQLLEIEEEFFQLKDTQTYYEIGSVYKKAVVDDILDNWSNISDFKKYSGIFATNSIEEAYAYHRLFKMAIQERNITFTFTTLFHPQLDETVMHSDLELTKIDALNEIYKDYEEQFDKIYNQSTHSWFKRDLSLRLAKKENYTSVSHDYEGDKTKRQLDLLIVVDQMLTGYDSKYVNAIYFDKTPVFQNLIQAISRTNRILKNKNVGHAVFYNSPQRMRQEVVDAFTIYAGVDLIDDITINDPDRFYTKINDAFFVIKGIFDEWDIKDFSHLKEVDSRAEDDKSLKIKQEIIEFASAFEKIRNNYRTSRTFGFSWERNEDPQELDFYQKVNLNEKIYKTLETRVYEAKQIINKHLRENSINIFMLENNEFLLSYEREPMLYSSDNIDARYLGNLINEYNEGKIDRQTFNNKINDLILDMPSEHRNLFIELLNKRIDFNKNDFHENHLRTIVKELYDETKLKINENKLNEINSFIKSIDLNWELIWKIIKNQDRRIPEMNEFSNRLTNEIYNKLQNNELNIKFIETEMKKDNHGNYIMIISNIKNWLIKKLEDFREIYKTITID